MNSPRPVSPKAKVMQTIGLSTITVEYSRPKVTIRGNDRTGNIWGTQIPYGFNKTNFGSQGDIPWRAGANENTIFSISDDVSINGKILNAGTYGLHMAIYEDGKVSVIFSSNYSSWGSFHYNEAEDVLRIDTKLEDHAKTKVLTYDFVDYGSNYTILALLWENKIIPIRIDIDTPELVYQSYKDQLRGVIGFGWPPYVTAANFCITNNIHLDQASKWADIAIAQNSSFQTLTLKAGILEAQGKNAEAMKMYDDLVTDATNVELNNLGYQMINRKKYAKAIEYFTLNVKRNKTDPNAYDSLGEAYKISGDNENAIKYLKKSLSLDPPENVKANSTRLLKELGVEVAS
jgi:tetratricopeptide (TPR) repeat protein